MKMSAVTKIACLSGALLACRAFAETPPLSHVSGGWQPYEKNPVLGNAKLGTCFDVNVVTDPELSPLDTQPSTYLMYFSWRPKHAIALVRSTDGFKWTQEPEICLKADPTSGWENDLNRSCTVKKDGLWHMWYTGQAKDPKRGAMSRIGYATSKDGVHFTRVRREPVMVPETDFEKASVMNPYVRWDAKRRVWRMWYAAGETYEPNVLCYAESADGLNWKKFAGNPIFTGSAQIEKGVNCLQWDRDRVGACEVHPLGDGRWAMFYIGYSDVDTARIGCAISADGVTDWKRLPQNPIVAPDLGTWNGSACYKPSVVRDEKNNRWLLYYNGRNGFPEYVGMAIHEGLDLEAPATLNLSSPSNLSNLLSTYVRRFNAKDEETWTNAISNAQAEEFMLKNCPRFACPDKDIERTYYFRWWTFRKHLRHDLDRWTVTEFGPKVPWSGKGNTIVCPAGHHLREGRWLRDPQFIADDATFWLSDSGATHRWGYSSWLFTGTCLFAEVSGRDDLPVALLDDAVRYYERWEKGFDKNVGGGKKFRQGGDDKGGFLSIDNYEGTEISLGGNGYKPLLASAMWSEATRIAEVARRVGRADLAEKFAAKAEVNRKSILEHCWNGDLKFFITQSVPPSTSGLPPARELHGYAPWYFGMPTDGRAADWSQLADPQGFAALYGLTFPERRAKGFTIDCRGHECKWNGPSWPFATSIALTAFANELHRGDKKAGDAKLFTELLWQYAAQQKRTRPNKGDNWEVVPWIDENLHPDKPEWLARQIILDTPEMRKNFPHERGKDYNHSTFCDLVISGLVGFIPNGAKGFAVDPLFPATWDYLVLENLRYRGHDVTIRWQRGGEGLAVEVDGKPVAQSAALGRLAVRTAASEQVTAAGSERSESVENINVRDPFVTVDRDAGLYRLYCAKPWFGGDAVFVRKSKDLKDWSEPAKVMTVDPAWKVSAVWAPEVHEYAGKWYLLVTLTQETGKELEPFPESCRSVKLPKRGTWAFVSESRDGPFRPLKEDSLTPPEWSCLDGTLWVEGGEPYLVFCHEWSQTGEGRMMCMKLKKDLSDRAGTPVELFRAGVQEKGGFKMNKKTPCLGAVTDGPFLYRSILSGRLTMIWSGCPVGGGYPTFMCESETGSVLGPWKRHGTLIRNGGHSMLFQDFSGTLLLSSHHPNGSPHERMRFTRIEDTPNGLREYAPDVVRADRYDRIQVNQAGYLPSATKRCFVEAPPTLTFRVQRLDEETGKRIWHDVFSGPLAKVPRTTALYEGDFSAVTRPGDYRIVCGAATRPCAYGPGPEYKGVLSCPFDIRAGVYDSAIRAMLGYYTWQRCGSKKGWAGVCHQEKCPLLDANGKVVGEVDARGGYHQSCDLRNWTDGISLSVFNLLRFAEYGAPRWDDGELEEELRWGLDHFLRISPKGFVYDSEFTPIGWGPVHYYARPAPYGAQANTVMLFARASRFFAKRDAAYAATLLGRARAIFRDMETNPFFDKAQPSGELPLPGGTQPWETWYQYNYRTTALGFSQRASAALELYRTTRDAAFLDLARQYARTAAEKRLEDGKDMLEVNCGYSRYLSSYRIFLELARECGDGASRAICLEKAEELRQKSRDALGPTSVYQGTASISLVTHAAFLLEAADVLGRPDFRSDAQRMVDWTLGANPQLQSLVEGIGYNQERRPVFGQFYPSTPQIPGAVLHRMRGEYDMPPVSWLLLDLRLLAASERTQR